MDIREGVAMYRLVVLGLLSLISLPAAADVAVEIVDYPTSVLRYSPVFVTGRIYNRGSSPVLVPVSNYTANRYFVEVGRTPESLTEQRLASASTASSDLVWLKPGQSWLFRVDIGFWLWSDDLGRYFIRVGLNGNGECLYRSWGDEGLPLKALVKEPGREIYECWSGHEVSEIISIDVHEPDAAIDRQALEFIRSTEFPVNCCLEDRFYLRLQFGAAALLKQFPTSHYTYAGIFLGGMNAPESLQRLLELQPTHPLTPYTRLQRALALINTGRGAEVTPSSVDALDLPEVLKDYLMQEKVLHEKRQKRSVGHGDLGAK